MELKVWVEGIQRVVCGANYSTTCQDVVLALAHAMGRTGRFTLVERWRDSERPLTPAECPLQALHKWGEYSAEVRFFLIQADGNAANTSNNSIGSGSSRGSKDADRALGNKLPSSQLSKPQQIRENEGPLLHRSRDTKPHHSKPYGNSYSSSPSPSPRDGFPSGPRQGTQKPYHSQLHHLQQSDHLKRSSTFSGAHNYAVQHPPPSSSSYSNNLSSQSSSTSSYPSAQEYSNTTRHNSHPQSNTHQQPMSQSDFLRNQSSSNLPNNHNQTNFEVQPDPQKTRRPSRGHHTSLAPPIANGGDHGTSGNSSSNSSPRSPSGLSASQGHYAPGSHPYPQASSSSNTFSSHHPLGSSASRSGEQRDIIHNDSRDLHPANVTQGRSSSSGSAPASRGMPSSAPGRHRENVSSEQTSHHPADARHRHPRRERRPRSPTPHRSGTAGQQQQQQQQQSHNHPFSQSKQDQHLPYSQNQQPSTNSSHHTTSGTQPHHQPQAPSTHSRKALPPRSSSPSPSTSPVPPVPAPRQRTRPSLDPAEYENIPSARGRDQRRGQHPSQQRLPQQQQESQSHQPPRKAPSPRRRELSQSRDAPRREDAGEPTRSGARADSTTTGPGAAWSTPGPPPTSGGLPSWSQAGRVGDTQRQQLEQHPHQNQRQQQLSKSLPASGMNLLYQNNEGGRSGLGNSLDFVESAAMRQQHPQQVSTHLSRGISVDGDEKERPKSGDNLSGNLTERGRTMSSFASAVANIRQHSRERRSSRGEDQTAGGKHQDHNKAIYPPQPVANPSFSNEDRQQPTRNSYRGGHFPQYSQHPIHNHQQQPHPEQINAHTGYALSYSQRSPSPPSFTLSPRHNSAFKEVSPRHSHQPSPSSPPVAFNFEHNKLSAGTRAREFAHHQSAQGNTLPRQSQHVELSGSLPEERPHFRQLSLEVEEYDLDQNFPDLTHRDRDGNTGVPSSAREVDLAHVTNLASSTGTSAHMDSTPLEYRLDSGGVRPAPHRAEAEYLQLARLVSLQLEQIKDVEVKIADASAEISTLEEEASHTDLQLQELSVTGAELEDRNLELSQEEVELERVEWDNVLDGERKREADIQQQISKLQDKMKETEERMIRLKIEEEEKSKEIKAEKERHAAETKGKMKLERETSEKLDRSKRELEQTNLALEIQRKEMEKLEEELSDAETQRKEREEELGKVELELKEENLKDFDAHPAAKEPPPGVTTVEDFVFPVSGYKKARPYTSTSSDTLDEDTEDTDTGEAIIKILEGRLSPSSPLSGELNKMAGMTSAQQTYKSALAAKNPNGVWV